LILWYI